MTEDVKVGQTVFVTKYALTRGIVEFRLIQANQGGTAHVQNAGNRNGQVIFGYTDWYRTREEAVKRARAMRDRKIKSAEMQIARLRALTF